MALYVVWSPQLGATEAHVPSATALVSDERANHYWDPAMAVGRAVSPHVGLGSPAWDVWLLYDRNATWGEGPMPAPAWWEHQLQSLPPERHLDPERYAREAAELLQR